MTLFDFGVLGILVVSVAISLLRGLAREMVSLGVWVGGFILATYFGGYVAAYLPQGLQPLWSALIGFLIIFALVLVIGWIVGMALSSAVRASGLAPADRALGSVRSEERRVGKECRSRGWPNQEQLKTVFITMQCTFCEQLLQIQVARILAVVYDIGDS